MLTESGTGILHVAGEIKTNEQELLPTPTMLEKVHWILEDACTSSMRVQEGNVGLIAKPYFNREFLSVIFRMLGKTRSAVPFS